MVHAINDYSSSEITRITGANQRTAKRWKSGLSQPPESALKLLRLLRDGDMTTILGKDWHDFRAINGLLYVPGWKRGFTAQEFRAMFFRVQQVHALEAENQRLKKEAEKYDRVFLELKRQRDFYRHQLILEARYGLALSRITA